MVGYVFRVILEEYCIDDLQKQVEACDDLLFSYILKPCSSSTHASLLVKTIFKYSHILAPVKVKFLI